MARGMTKEEKYRQMIETPVNRLIPRLAVPTIISMLVTSIYNMADTFFVSQLSTSASGAVGVMFSAMSMIQAIGFTLGMGSGNHISRSLEIGMRSGQVYLRQQLFIQQLLSEWGSWQQAPCFPGSWYFFLEPRKPLLPMLRITQDIF